MLRVTDFAFVILNEVKNLAEAKAYVKCGRLIIAPTSLRCVLVILMNKIWLFYP